jgi:hypothetical protein
MLPDRRGRVEGGGSPGADAAAALAERLGQRHTLAHTAGMPSSICNLVRYWRALAAACALTASLVPRSAAAELPYPSFRRLSNRQLERTQLALEYCGNQTASLRGIVVGVVPQMTSVEADSARVNWPADATTTVVTMKRLIATLGTVPRATDGVMEIDDPWLCVSLYYFQDEHRYRFTDRLPPRLGCTVAQRLLVALARDSSAQVGLKRWVEYAAICDR